MNMMIIRTSYMHLERKDCKLYKINRGDWKDGNIGFNYIWDNWDSSSHCNKCPNHKKTAKE